MSTPTDPLVELHDDLIYLLECLAEQIYGEARFELGKTIDRWEELDPDTLPEYAEYLKDLHRINTFFREERGCAGMICNLRQRVRAKLTITSSLSR